MSKTYPRYNVYLVEGGHQIFWCPSPHEKTELNDKKRYSTKQAAHRRCKQLNDALKKVDQMIARDGAIII